MGPSTELFFEQNFGGLRLAKAHTCQHMSSECVCMTVWVHRSPGGQMREPSSMLGMMGALLCRRSCLMRSTIQGSELILYICPLSSPMSMRCRCLSQQWQVLHCPPPCLCYIEETAGPAGFVHPTAEQIKIPKLCCCHMYPVAGVPSHDTVSNSDAPPGACLVRPLSLHPVTKRTSQAQFFSTLASMSFIKLPRQG